MKIGYSDENRCSFARVSAELGPPTIDCISVGYRRPSAIARSAETTMESHDPSIYMAML